MEEKEEKLEHLYDLIEAPKTDEKRIERGIIVFPVHVKPIEFSSGDCGGWFGGYNIPIFNVGHYFHGKYVDKAGNVYNENSLCVGFKGISIKKDYFTYIAHELSWMNDCYLLLKNGLSKQVTLIEPEDEGEENE